MKNHYTKLLLTLLIALPLFTSCSNETIIKEPQKEKASLAISLAKAPISRALTAVTQAEENAINNMMVFVFKAGNLESRAEIKGSKGRINDLSTGAKVIRVITNPSTNLTQQLNKVTTLKELEQVAMELTDEWNEQGEMAPKGLTMTGESEQTLKAGNDNKAVINVKRVVAKVILGKLDIKLLEGYDIKEFEVTAISVMKVRSKSLLGFPNYLLPNLGEDFQFMGGLKGKVSTLFETRLLTRFDSITDIENLTNPYFYITPNNNEGDNCTLMTLSAVYKGKPQNFAFRINDKIVSGYEKITGDYIQANRQYTLNILIKRPIGVDPEDPKTESSLEVTVIPEEWVVVPDQNAIN